MNKKFSIIIPVYNEIMGVKDFLDSIYNQSRKADEIILVDGKSNDGTLEYLKNEEQKGKIKVFSFRCNIAEARNYAIKNAKNEIILCTDAGCVVDKNWCENIMQIYETTDHKVVGGKSDYIVTNEFQQKVKNRIVSPDPNFSFVSSRNISFYKEAWEKVGGYPEYLTKWGEDTYFNYMIENMEHEIFFCKTAVVKRGMGKNYKDFYKMYRNYTQGDMEVFVIHRVVQSPSIKQSSVFLLFWLFTIALLFALKRYAIVAYLAILLMLGFYKRSGGGFIFDLKFSLAKMAGMSVGLIKGLIKGVKIKKKLNKKDYNADKC